MSELQLIEKLHIHDIADDGMAVGRHENQVIFVKHAVPGDVIDVNVFKKKKKYAHASIVKVVMPSVHRTDPFCTHFGTCGGCKWQYLDYPTQLFYKQKMVVDALQHIGGLSGFETNNIVASANTKHYRNKLEFTFSNKRWLTVSEMGNTDLLMHNALGFHVPGKFDKVLDINECFLQDDKSNQIRLFVKDFCLTHNFSFFDIRQQTGLMRNLVIRNTTNGEWMVVVVFFENDAEKINLLMNAIRTQFNFITSLQYIINPKKNDSYSDLTAVLFSGLPHITEVMENLKFQISAKAFFQTNPVQAHALYNAVLKFADLQSHHIVYDLYTGTGTIANYMAPHCKHVVGIEYVEEAVKDAQVNSAINNLSNTVFYAGDMRKILTEEIVQQHGTPDVIITDPPRGGMDAAVVAQLLKINAQRIVYVSCNAATQARDITLMSNHYTLQSIQPFDMFPHTHHVENIALLIRKN
nr:23S rRNA (uracil(1939)-C(5))-methyltransferase RlmD [Bacteroidota bacterium]